jgi:uncharacterized glyoxalase superfamily protein PhnB
MKKIMPNLMVKDVKETVEFYENNLNFNLEMAVPETQDGILTEIPETKNIVYALVKNGNVELQFQVEETLKKDITVFVDSTIGASVSFYMEVENLDAFYEEIKGKVEVVKELSTTWYGMNEFYIYDNNGYVLGFAEQKV